MDYTEKIIEEYKNGKSIYALKRKYKKSETKIRNMLTRAGVSIRGHDVDKATVNKILDMKKEGMPNKDIAVALRMSEQQISYYVRKYLKKEDS